MPTITALWWPSAGKPWGVTGEKGKGQCWDVLALAVPDIWLEAWASSQALEPCFSFLPQVLDFDLLPNLGCWHCRCLRLSA